MTGCACCSVESLSEPLRRRLTGCLTAIAASADSFLVGTWLSLVEHSLGVRGVGSSNLPVPTIHFHAFFSGYPQASHFSLSK